MGLVWVVVGRSMNKSRPLRAGVWVVALALEKGVSPNEPAQESERACAKKAKQSKAKQSKLNSTHSPTGPTPKPNHPFRSAHLPVPTSFLPSSQPHPPWPPPPFPSTPLPFPPPRPNTTQTPPPLPSP